VGDESSRERIIGLMGAVVGSMVGAVVGSMVGAVISSIRAIVGSMGAVVVGSMGAVVGSMGAVLGSMGRLSERRSSEVMVRSRATIAKGSRVLAATAMSWEGEAHGGSRQTRQRRGTWPPMAGGINT